MQYTATMAEEAVEEPQYEPEAEAEEEEEEEEEFVAVGGATEVKLFGKWSFDDIEIRDISLVVSNRSWLGYTWQQQDGKQDADA